MSKERKLFQVHNHVNVFRANEEAEAGPVSEAEQIAGVKRFIRWHQRQVEIGKALLATIEGREVKATGLVILPPAPVEDKQEQPA